MRQVLWIISILACWKSSTSISDWDDIPPANRSKDWIAYLKYTLENELSYLRPTVVQHLTELRYPIRQLINWCKLPRIHNFDIPIEIRHLRPWLPCGSGLFQLNQHVAVHTTHCFRLLVYRMLYIHMMFFKFEMDASGDACIHSSLKIMQPNYENPSQRTWDAVVSYCGYREPWNITFNSHSLAICVKQLNVHRPYNVTFRYISIDRWLGSLYDLGSNETHVNVTSLTDMRISHKDYAKQRWIIRTQIGYVQRFHHLQLSGDLNYFKIYDGLKLWFPLVLFDNMTSGSWNINSTTSYFMSQVMIKSQYNSIHRSLLLNFTFSIRMLTAIPLQQAEEFRFQSSNQISHKLYSIKPANGLYSGFEYNVSEFRGWNSGNCDYGGYSILQYVDDPIIRPNVLGPFCSATSLRHSFTESNHLSRFLFGNHTTYIIFYAYSYMYTLDIDIIVKTSKCEGIDPFLVSS